jgi:transposase-like protein
MDGDGHPQAGIDYPGNWQGLLDWFPDEPSCLRYLERLRWGEHFACRFCGAVDDGWWQMTDGLRRCARCRAETSVTAGTIFAGTRSPLRLWFAACWYVVNQKNGVSALGLQHVLGLGSYETAWTWLHKLRRAMVRPGRDLLEGAVEVDESYVGGLRRGTGGRGAAGKAIIVIAVEDRGKAAGRVRMQRVPNVTKDALTDFVLDNVARGSEVHTDAWPGYDDIGRYRFDHRITSLNATGDPAHVVLPHVHLVASLLKRWLLGTHQGAVTDHQLDYYLDEFTFRFNRRRSRHRGLLFYRLLEQAVATNPHPYDTLTANPAHS